MAALGVQEAVADTVGCRGTQNTPPPPTPTTSCSSPYSRSPRSRRRNSSTMPCLRPRASPWWPTTWPHSGSHCWTEGRFFSAKQSAGCWLAPSRPAQCNPRPGKPLPRRRGRHRRTRRRWTRTCLAAASTHCTAGAERAADWAAARAVEGLVARLAAEAEACSHQNERRIPDRQGEKVSMEWEVCTMEQKTLA